MTMLQMREELKKVYRAQKWRDRVDKMSDEQVFATYTRIKNAGKL